MNTHLNAVLEEAVHVHNARTWDDLTPTQQQQLIIMSLEDEKLDRTALVCEYMDIQRLFIHLLSRNLTHEEFVCAVRADINEFLGRELGRTLTQKYDAVYSCSKRPRKKDLMTCLRDYVTPTERTRLPKPWQRKRAVNTQSVHKEG